MSYDVNLAESTIKVSTCQGDKAASVGNSGDYVRACIAFVSVHSGVVILEKKRREMSLLGSVSLFFWGERNFMYLHFHFFFCLLTYLYGLFCFILFLVYNVFVYSFF